MQATDIDMTKWDYLWSIVRGNKCGEIFVESGLSGMSDPKYLLILKDGQKVFAPKETDELEGCRIVAEEFVMNDYIWE